MRRSITLILCLILWLCLSLWLFGCIEEKGEDINRSSNTDISGSSNTGGGDNETGNTEQSQQTRNAQVVRHGSIREIIDYEGCIELLGELKNVGDVPATFCKITFTFRDDTSDGPIGSAYTYVEGTNKTITTIDSESSTVLDPDDVGAFMVFTDLPYDSVTHYEYDIEWREDETSPPDAKLNVVDGSITSSSGDEYNDYHMVLSGNVENTGNQTAILSYITFVLKDSIGDVIGVAPLNPVKGTTISLPDVSGSTDTAVLPGGTGTFATWSIMLYEGEASSYYYKIKWFDYRETASHGRARDRASDLIDIDQDDPKFLWKERDQEIDELKEEVQWKEGISSN